MKSARLVVKPDSNDFNSAGLWGACIREKEKGKIREKGL